MMKVIWKINRFKKGLARGLGLNLLSVLLSYLLIKRYHDISLNAMNSRFSIQIYFEKSVEISHICGKVLLRLLALCQNSKQCQTRSDISLSVMQVGSFFKALVIFSTC